MTEIESLSVYGPACFRWDSPGVSSSSKVGVQFIGWKLVPSPSPVTVFLLLLVRVHWQQSNHASKALGWLPSGGKGCLRLCPNGTFSPRSCGKTFAMKANCGSSPSAAMPS